jgi:N,N'-diacetyllegionaminate synthase
MTQIIAECGLSHDGSLNLAHAFIDAVADAGADGVKFQIHHPDEGTADEPWRKEWSHYHETRRGYWQRTAFTAPQWCGLANHADRRGLKFGASVFSETGAVVLGLAQPDFWKVSAGMVANRPLLHAIRDRMDADQAIILSAGLSDLHALEDASDCPAALRQRLSDAAHAGRLDPPARPAWPVPSLQVGSGPVGSQRQHLAGRTGVR